MVRLPLVHTKKFRRRESCGWIARYVPHPVLKASVRDGERLLNVYEGEFKRFMSPLEEAFES